MTLNNVTYKDKIKPFLEQKLSEYNKQIKKLKKRRKIVKSLFIISILVSVSCSTVCATMVAFLFTPVIISILSTAGALTTILSLKFNLEGKKEELNKVIEKLDKIKHKLDYVVACNGDFTEIDYRQIIEELS